MPKKLFVTAIIPVFNEEKTIENVIVELLKHPLINEVICINDGSTDRSLAILESFDNRLVVINLKKNKGKGYAMALGIQKAAGDIIAFFDADLINLSKRHITLLVNPLLQGKARVSMGQFGGFTQQLTGERAYFKEDILPHCNSLKKTGFGAETYINNVFKHEKIAKVKLSGLNLLYKHQKHGIRKALKGYTKEGAEIMYEIARQKGILPRNYQLEKLMQLYPIEEVREKLKTSRLQVKRIAQKTFEDIL